MNRLASTLNFWRATLAAALLVLACACAFAQPPAVFPGAEWELATPESQNVSSAKLNDALDYLKQNAGADGIREVVVVRNGYIIWHGDSIDKVHGIWSCTKSFTSTVLGLLIDDGKCSLDTHASRYVPELGDAFPQLTLRHFTTMTSGYRAQGDEPKGTYLHGPSLTPFAPADKPLFQPPGSQYAYWDSAMNMFAHVLTRIAGEPIEELFRRRIADPIEMNREHWDWGDLSTVDGVVVNGGSGNSNKHIFISAREIARLGLLFLNRGRWQERQLLSPEWITAATSVQVPATTPLGQPESGIDGRGVYGFNWWVNGIKPDGRRQWPAAPEGTFAASGHNNNKMFVIPQWNMVIVRLGLDQKDVKISDEVWNTFLGRVGESLDSSSQSSNHDEGLPAAKSRRVSDS
jgi:CubicO group peptidase (beta-lactamase class C family)